MAFELLISFVEPDPADQARTKADLVKWLEAVGRSDYVEGVIDGVDSVLDEDEKASGAINIERFDSAPIAIFNEEKQICLEFLNFCYEQFGSRIRGRISEISDETWSECWRETFSPLETELFFIAPLGSPAATPSSKIRIELANRGHAFGTGQHATTRAVIGVLEKKILEWQCESLLDVGTGTGIYMVMAGLLGVKCIVGTEISEELADCARENCEIAGVATDIQVTEKPNLNQRFDVVVSNILLPVLLDLLPSLITHLSARGRLVLAGFIEKEQHVLLHMALEQGLHLTGDFTELGWKCLVFEFKANPKGSV